MTTHKTSLLVLVLVIALGSVRCGYKPELHATAQDWLTIKLGESPIHVQIAISAKERAEGLMHRETLEPDQGMLFVFETPSKQRFWMKNTLIPLSIGFFDTKGRLVEIHNLYPQDRNPVESRTDTIVMALEMRQGWFQEHKVVPGTTFDKALLDEAFLRRGMDVQNYPWYHVDSFKPSA